MRRRKGIWRATTRPKARREAEDERERARSFQARMEEFGRTAESADAAARDAGAEAEGAVQAAFAARDSALAEAANARARAVMLDEQLRDLRQQVERGDPASCSSTAATTTTSCRWAATTACGWTSRRCGRRRRSRPHNFLSCEFLGRFFACCR